MHPGTFSPLNTLLDGSGTKYRSKDGKLYSIGENFRLLMCFNEGAQYSGTREVNAALKDRLMPIYCDYLKPAEEIKILTDRCRVDADTAKKVVDLAGQIRAAGKNIGFDLSPRALIRMLVLKRNLMSWQQAFEYAVLNLIGCPVEKAAHRSTIKMVADNNSVSYWAEPKFH
jgi:hypothetical protein